MCGIFGVVSSKKKINLSNTKKILDKLFLLSEVRGSDASGIYFKNTLQNSILKKIIKPKKFIRLNEYKKFIEDYYNKSEDFFSFIGQCRLTTYGNKNVNKNNQPIQLKNLTTVFNGHITNLDEQFSNEKFKDFTDTELLLSAIEKKYKNNDLIDGFSEITEKFNGIINLIFTDKDSEKFYFFTNNGSLYLAKINDIYIFASEKYIIDNIIKNFFKNSKDNFIPISKNFIYELNYNTKSIIEKKVNLPNGYIKNSSKLLKNNLPIKKNYTFIEDNSNKISRLKRCSKCILPETYPFIEFDQNNVCNYCKIYKPKKPLGLEKLHKLILQKNSIYKKNRILVGLSGGRDSCFALHKLYNLEDIEITAYTYDWGLTTDKARINQSKICSKLGIEHIIRAADIDYKRNCIKKNILAWIKNPHLGMVPLFFVGDKPFYYYGQKLLKDLNIPLLVDGAGNQTEQMEFKIGFCGIDQKLNNNPHLMFFPRSTKFKLLLWYSYQYLINPSYINDALSDSVFGFFISFYMNYTANQFYDFYKWDEKEIDFELEKNYGIYGNKSFNNQWRIGDGQTAFTNYIWYNRAGFSEFDNYRSNQIREGLIEREEAMRLVLIDNQPKVEAIEQFCDLISINFEEIITKINNQKKLY